MKKIIITVLILINLLTAQSFRLKDDTGRINDIPVYRFESIECISLSDFALSQNARTYYNQDTRKLVINLPRKKVVFSAFCSFVIINETTVHIPFPVEYRDDNLYIPIVSLIPLVTEYLFSESSFDIARKSLEYTPGAFNLIAESIEVKANGALVRVRSRKVFPEKSIQSWVSERGWLYVTIPGGLVDSLSFKSLQPGGVIKEIVPIQLAESVQLAIKLRDKIESHEIYQTRDPNQIVISIRTPLKQTAKQIESLKSKWLIDTIVLDAGHGGKDPGCVGKGNLYEKDITLDIVLKLGQMLEKKGLNVIYTRKSDVFIPLWQRTKIANESSGKLFLSIHVNSHKNKNIRGTETFLLRPGKTQDAIEVAERENSVIRLEETSEQYKNFDNIQLILASLAQNAFMKESEDLAAMIQDNFQKELKAQSRGVKQAGFYVLVGASMPNALVEVGFISNQNERNKLKKSSYRKAIATALYNSILKFKNKYEQQIVESGSVGS